MNQNSLNGSGPAKRPSDSDSETRQRVARNVATRLKQSHIVIVMIDVDSNQMDVASYGRTDHERVQAKALGQIAYDAVYDELARRTNG